MNKYHFHDKNLQYQHFYYVDDAVLGDYDDRWGYDIIDGTHRANALKKSGLKCIVSFVGINNYQNQVY